MTKAELIDALSEYHDDDIVVIEVHDTMLSEDLYDFAVDAVWLGVPKGQHPAFGREQHELRLPAINHHETLNPVQ